MSMVKAKASALRRSIDIQNQFGVVAVKQEKKKNAIGVRGMKLTGKDYVEQVYYTGIGLAEDVLYKEKTLDFYKLKTAKRDGRGTRVRI